MSVGGIKPEARFFHYFLRGMSQRNSRQKLTALIWWNEVGRLYKQAVSIFTMATLLIALFLSMERTKNKKEKKEPKSPYRFLNFSQPPQNYNFDYFVVDPLTFVLSERFISSFFSSSVLSSFTPAAVQWFFISHWNSWCANFRNSSIL